MSISTVISFGEFLDKLTILEIKCDRIQDSEKLENVKHERDVLSKIWKENEKSSVDITAEYSALKKINEQLWEIEDDIRDKERNKEFGKEFIELARAVYVTNDERARIKKLINMKLGSELIEEKSYSDYK